MSARHTHHSKVVTAFVRIPEPIPEGKVRCRACGRPVAVSSAGRTWRHKSPAGEDCAYIAVYGAQPDLGSLPEVVIPANRLPGQTARVSPRGKRDPDSTPRLDVGSHCQEPGCGKWLPGERMLCGQHARQREEARKRR